MDRDETDRMIGRAVMDLMKRSVHARKMLKKMLGDVVDTVPEAEEGYDYPAIDLIGSPEEIVVLVDLPGTEKEKIDLRVTEDSLFVEAKLLRPEGEYLHRERFQDRAKRTIKLLAEVKPELVKASYANGVLEVRVPKLIVVKPQTVTIE